MSVTTRADRRRRSGTARGADRPGLSLEEAAAAALATEPGFDLQMALAQHLTGGSFAACH